MLQVLLLLLHRLLQRLLQRLRGAAEVFLAMVSIPRSEPIVSC